MDLGEERVRKRDEIESRVSLLESVDLGIIILVFYSESKTQRFILSVVLIVFIIALLVFLTIEDIF